MSWRWRDAEAAAAWLLGEPEAAALLMLVGRLAPLELTLLGPLTGAWESAARARVAPLLGRGLVAAARPAYRSPPPPRLLYATDLAVAALSLLRDADPRRLAAELGWRRADLVWRAARLFDHLDALRLLGMLAASRPGTVELLRWEHPWRPARAGCAAAAYAALSWDGDAHAYVLLPDAGTVPTSAFAPVLRALARARDRELHGLRVHDFPRVVVAAPPEGLDGWRARLEAPDPARRTAGLAHALAAWDDPPARLAGPGQRCLAVPPVPPPPRAPARPRHPGRAVPRVVGDLAAPPRDGAPARHRVAHALLRATGAELRLLGSVATDGPAEAAALARAGRARGRDVGMRLARLEALGLIRALERDEVAHWPERRPFPRAHEVTPEGLAVWAATLRQPPSRAARLYGVTGGGPDRPLGHRADALSRLPHAIGLAACMALLEAGLVPPEDGGDAVLLAREGASRCGAGASRPDGRLRFRVGDRVYEALVEYERGTAKGAGGYPRKFRRHHGRYAARHAAEPPYAGHPARPFLLVVVDHHRDADWAAHGVPLEERLARGDRLAARIARAARAEDAAAGRPLPVYVALRLRLAGGVDWTAAPLWRRAPSRRLVRLPLRRTERRGTFNTPLAGA